LSSGLSSCFLWK
jgi:hypothetical protein